jgi:hypothetical protein
MCRTGGIQCANTAPPREAPEKELGGYKRQEHAGEHLGRQGLLVEW